jgi:hypothetical protein
VRSIAASRLPAWAALAGLVALSAGLRFWAGLAVDVPWITPDEIVYAELGRNLWESATLGVLGERISFYSLVYPALVGLPLSVGDVAAGYDAAKAVQAVAMSLAAVPVYLWGRTLMPRAWALVAAALTLAVPGLAYAGLLMTEVAFYPVLVLAAWAAARALAEPTRANQALLLGAIVLACATRLQAVVLIPVVATAALLGACFERRPRALLELWPTYAGIAAFATAWAAYRLRGGGSLSQLLAAYEAAGEGGYQAGESARFVLYHAGDLLLLTGIVPVCAVVVLALRAAAGREPSAPARAYLAVAVSLAFWLVVEVGVFASVHVERLAERDLLGAVPVLFLGLALWLARAGPRPQPATAVVALLAAAAVVTLPLDELVVEEGLQDAFTTIGLFRLGGDADTALYVGTGIAVALFGALPRRLLTALPALLAGALVAASVVASDEVVDRSKLTQRRLLGPDPGWVDRAAASGVAYLYDGEAYWNAVWEHVFWNRDIEAVYALPGTLVPGPLPQEFVRVRPDGTIVRRDGGAPADHAVAGTPIQLVGERLAETTQEGTSQRGLALWRLEGTPRLSTRAAGVLANGDIHAGARLDAYACTEGTFELRIFAKGPRRVELRTNGRAVERLQLADGQSWGGGLPVRGDGGICTLEIQTDGLLGSTQLEFKRPS